MNILDANIGSAKDNVSSHLKDQGRIEIFDAFGIEYPDKNGVMIS